MGPPVLARWAALAEAHKIWATANPDLCSAWDAALEEDDVRRIALERKRWEEARVKSIPRALERMGVPERLWTSIQAEELKSEAHRRFWGTPSMVKARAFLDSPKNFLLLLGSKGSGKSAAASWLLTHARRRRYEEWEEIDHEQGCFIRASEACRISRFDDDGQWDHVLVVRWLVIDELGNEVMSDYWRERINELIDVRYGSLRSKTIITANITAQEFNRRYGDRIASRLRECAIIADAGTEDYRKQEAKI